MFGDDHAMLHWGMLLYDSLYTWCATRSETHDWDQRRYALARRNTPGAA
jgi:hypothetical protein